MCWGIVSVENIFIYIQKSINLKQSKQRLDTDENHGSAI